MVKTCDVKGFHEYTNWRTIETKRAESTIAGMSYAIVATDYYVRNCKHCGKLDSAPNKVVMGIKSRQGGKIKALGLVRTNGSK